MLKNAFLLSFMLLLGTVLSAQVNNGSKSAPSTGATLQATSQSPEKEDVKRFGLSIIKSYFDRDCNVLFNSLADQVRSKESGQVFQKTPELRTALCAESPLRTDISVNYMMYTANYNQKIYNYNEFVSQFPQLQTVYKLEQGDYFFLGSEPKSAGATRVFRASDMASFVVRKQNGRWVILAM
jgi:hypothetical protein